MTYLYKDGKLVYKGLQYEVAQYLGIPLSRVQRDKLPQGYETKTKHNTYYVYDTYDNNKLVFKGDYKGVQKYLYIADSYVSNCVKHGVLALARYRIEKSYD